jgi:hypothetical protein
MKKMIIMNNLHKIDYIYGYFLCVPCNHNSKQIIFHKFLNRKLKLFHIGKIIIILQTISLQ